MLTLAQSADRLAVSARTVPIFTQMRYADLPERFKVWLALDHGLNESLADTLAAIMAERRARYCWCDE